MKKSVRLLFLIFLCAACASKQVKKDQSIVVTEEQVEKNAAAVTVPTIIDTPTKADIEDRLLDSRMISTVEIGSPDSLRAAVRFIAADPKGLNDTNRLYLVLISEIMKRLYPHERIDWNVPLYQGKNKYLRAFSQVDNGIVPQDLGDSTFLSLIVPCFFAVSHPLNAEQIVKYENTLKTAESLMPQSVLPPFMLALMYDRNGQSSQAKQAYKKAYELDVSCTQAGLNYARILAKTGNSTAALRLLSELTTLKESDEYKLVLSESYIAEKQYDKASEIVVALLTENPENTEAVLLRIKMLIAKKEYLKANALLDAFATKNKSSKDYLLLRASLALNWSKSTSTTLALLNQAYADYPNDFDVLLACAKLCFETGQSIQGKTAENFIAIVTAKDASNAEAANLIVRNAVANENWTLAVTNAETLNELNPSIENNQLLALSYLGAGQTAKAFQVAHELYIQDTSSDEQICALYLESLSRIGNISELLRVINDKMPTASNSLKSILYYYQAKISSGEVKLSYLRSSLLADPRNIKSLFAMYQYYSASGDYKKSEYYLKQVIAIEPLNKKNIRLLQELQAKLKP